MRLVSAELREPKAIDWVAIYGESSADPLRERMIGIAYEASTRNDPSLPSGKVGDVLWRTFFPPQDVGEDSEQIGVITRGFTEAETRTIAARVEAGSGRRAERLDRRPTLASVPRGLTLLASTRVSLAALNPSAGGIVAGTTSLAWFGTGASLLVITAADDNAHRLLFRLTVDDTDGAVIRGHRGFSGPSVFPQRAGMRPALARTWVENGTIVYVASSGLPARQLDRVVTSLHRVGDEAEWRDALERLGGVKQRSGPTATRAPK
jgi:hypothetical protein